MKLVSKIKIKTTATNIKELYIGFTRDKIVHRVQLNKCDSIYEGKLYFNYKQDNSVYFKIIPVDNGSNHDPFGGRDELVELHTNEFELVDYQTTYNLEINEKKERFDEWYNDDYFYGYTIKKI